MRERMTRAEAEIVHMRDTLNDTRKEFRHAIEGLRTDLDKLVTRVTTIMVTLAVVITLLQVLMAQSGFDTSLKVAFKATLEAIKSLG